MIKTYKNGNVTVSINLEDGTKIRETQDNEFKPDFAESVDVHISDCCNNRCEFCYAGCTPDGAFGKLTGWHFLRELHPYTEMAINIQRPVPPNLIHFLDNMKAQKIIVNATVNQNHFMDKTFRIFLKRLQSEGLIHGLGISLVKPTEDFLNLIKGFDNVVIHVINGIVTTAQLDKMAHKGIKLLILGYKNIGRGSEYIEDTNTRIKVRNRKGFLYWDLRFILEEKWFEIISFDNLALEQLNVKRFLSDEEWNEFYMGDDGSHTFFINLVDGTFGKNSLTAKGERLPIGDKTIDEMFHEILKMSKET